MIFSITTRFRTQAFSFVLILLLNGYSNAQETKVSGRIYDPLTNETIPFAAVVFKGTTIGTTSDINGNFMVSTMVKVDSISCSFVGYLPVTLPVQKGKDQVMNFALRVNKFDLPEVSVKAGENPADIIMRKVRDNKKNNNHTSVSAYQFESYNKIEFDINNISERFRKKKLFKPFRFVFDNMDSSATNKKPFLPVFLTETLSDIYFTRDPQRTKEIVKAAKISGIENNTISQYLGDFYQHINVYDNYIYLFGKGFVSPISDVGAIYYKYYLLDSSYIGNKWCYKMKFKARRKQELTFTGEVWIHDSTFAVKKISMRIADDANINFIEDAVVVDEYDFINRKQWMLTKEILVMNIAPTEQKNKETMGFIARKTTTYRDFILDEPKPPSFFKDGEAVTVLEDASKKDETFWDHSRHDTLSKNEKKIYEMVDTLKSLPVFQTYLDVITVLATGYYAVGPFDVGQLFSLYNYNSLEGSRVKIGGRTNNRFSKTVGLNGYAAYGFKDRKYKYGGGIDYYFDDKRSTSFGVSYKQDVEQLGKASSAFESDNLIITALSRLQTGRYSSIEQQKVYIERDLFKGFTTNVAFFHKEIRPLNLLDFSYYTDATRSFTRGSIISSEASLGLRFAYKERYVESGRKGAVGRKTTKISLGSVYPIMQVVYTLGLKESLGSDFRYHKLRFHLDDNLFLGNFGYTWYEFEAGKIWGTIPYPLLEVHKGNETYTYNPDVFNLMNYFEFVSDEFLSATVIQHFGGVFLDRFPLLRKLKLREVASAKFLIGRVSDANREIMVDREAFNSLETPYIEGGVGIENILKFGRIDLVKRFSHLNNENVASIGFRFSFEVRF